MRKCYMLFLLVLPGSLFAQEYLTIGDVQDSWTTYNGSIDKAVMVVTPKGLYAECQVLLDFSVKCTPFNDPMDSLEIQMGFRLPHDAEVIDLWLWMFDIPVQAGMYDRYTASQIYESYVDRRTDPALLVKNSDTDYELHIFPLMVNMPRKIKLTFLLPIDKITESKSQVSLPLNILKLSDCPIDSILVGFKAEANLDEPLLTELPAQVFQVKNDPVFGEVQMTQLTNITQLSSMTLSMTPEEETNVFVGFHAEDNLNGEYQFELDLAEIFAIEDHKKTVFLIDFIDGNSSLTESGMIQSLENYVSSWFGPGDSVNFMFSGSSITWISGTWISADSASLANAFASMDANDISGVSNLDDLLIDGVTYIQDKGNEGSLVLIGSSNGYTNPDDADELYGDVISLMGNSVIPIHTINLDEDSYVSFWDEGIYWRGNEYLYLNLSTLTGGEFFTCLEYSYDEYYWYYESTFYSFENLLGSLLPMLSGYFTAVDVYASPETGFTYANYDFSSYNGFVYYGSPYRQVGKYYGESPLNISVSALTSEGMLYNTDLTLDSDQLFAMDSITGYIWAGQNLRDMLSFAQTTTTVYEIIDLSRQERVLCKYTAFLALEPGTTHEDTVHIPITAGSGGIGGGVGDITSAGEDLILADCYPNPAVSVVVFDVQSNKASDAIIEIYDLHGRLVARLSEEVLLSTHHAIPYDVSHLEAGVYIYSIRSDGRLTATGKLIVAD